MNKFVDKMLETRLGRAFLLSAGLHFSILGVSKLTRDQVINVIDVTPVNVPPVEIDSESLGTTEGVVRDLSSDEVLESLPINEIQEVGVSAEDFVGPQREGFDEPFTQQEIEERKHASKVKKYYMDHYADRLWNSYSKHITDRFGPQPAFSYMLHRYIVFKYLSELAVSDNLSESELKTKEIELKRNLNKILAEFKSEFKKGMSVSDIVVTLNRILLSTSYKESQSGLANYLLDTSVGLNCEARAILTSFIVNRSFGRFFNSGWEFVIQKNGGAHVRTVLRTLGNSFYPIDGAFVRGTEKDFSGVLFEREILELLTGRYTANGHSFSPDKKTVTSTILDSVNYTKKISSEQFKSQKQTKFDPLINPNLKPKVIQWQNLKNGKRVPLITKVDANEFLSQQIKIARRTGENIVDLNNFRSIKIAGDINLSDFTVFDGIKVLGLEKNYSKNVVFHPSSLTGLSNLVENGWDFSRSILNLNNLSPNSNNSEDVSMFKETWLRPDQFLDYIDKGIDVSAFSVDVKFFKNVNDSVRFTQTLNERGVKYVELVGKTASDLDFQSFNGVIKNTARNNGFDVQFNKVTFETTVGFGRLVFLARGKKVNFKVLYLAVDNTNLISKLNEFLSVMNGRSVDLRIVATSDDSLNQQYIDAGFKVERLDK